MNPVPDLDQIANDPLLAGELSPEVATALLAKCTSLQSVLIGRLLELQASGNGHHAQANQEDRLLTVEEAASKLGLTQDWIYRRTSKLPFIVRQGRLVRCSLKGIEKYIRQRQGRG